MREDMDKVIVERERIGSSDPNGDIRSDRRDFSNHKNDVEYLETLPKTMWMRARGWDPPERKELNENLSPLYRFLNSKVGCKWDDVYSELRSRINPNSAVQMHIIEHIDGIVERDVIIIDGKACYGSGRYWYGKPIKATSRRWSTGLYVHPVTKILCRSDIREERYKRWVDPNVVKLNELNFLRFECGIWYHYEYENAVERYRQYLSDVTQVEMNPDGTPKPNWVWATRPIVRFKTCHQLNKKELKKYGLKNDPLWEQKVDPR